jgi:hypothetical protein
MAGWDEGLAELEAEFSGWHVWRSNAGRWWATRTGAVLRREDLGTGRVMTVDADDVGSLRKLLLAQSRLDRDVSRLVALWTTVCAPVCRTLWITAASVRSIEHVM